MSSNSSIKSFKIDVPESSIASLKEKLSSAIFPDKVDFSNSWDYGAPLGEVKRLAKYWKDDFDWRAQEAKINQIPQFTTSVEVEGFDDVELHFVHKPSERKGARPLLFVHGCESSVLQVF